MSNPVGSFIWYELMTSDADAAAKFYGTVIGWKIGARADANLAVRRDIHEEIGGSARNLIDRRIRRG